ncbi:MAG TPA: cyclic nucleotide-binding domain-containing protein [Candidatus Acidoferrales bacterium]|nr:cyclic nucleotide-binding domain-containing protein [Candidatus Acidoferrales bacterium]
MTTTRSDDELHIAKGDTLFRQGEPGHEMFVIERGKMRLTIGADGVEKEVATLGPGQFFGELSLLADAPRSATAEAMEDSVLLAIRRDVFNMMVQDDLDIVYRMMSIQGQRLSQTNQPIQQLGAQIVRIRIATYCLRQLRAAKQSFPASLTSSALAGILGEKPEVTDATLSDLANRGVGTFSGGRLTVAGREQVEHLIDVICDYAEGR